MKGSGFATGRRIFPEQIVVTRDTRAPAECDQEILPTAKQSNFSILCPPVAEPPVSASYRDRGKDA